jgi:hypothetical protein
VKVNLKYVVVSHLEDGEIIWAIDNEGRLWRGYLDADSVVPSEWLLIPGPEVKR